MKKEKKKSKTKQKQVKSAEMYGIAEAVNNLCAFDDWDVKNRFTVSHFADDVMALMEERKLTLAEAEAVPLELAKKILKNRNKHIYGDGFTVFSRRNK